MICESRDAIDKSMDPEALKQAGKQTGTLQKYAASLLKCGKNSVNDLLSARTARKKGLEQKMKKEVEQVQALAKAAAKAAPKAKVLPRGPQAPRLRSLPPIYFFRDIPNLDSVTQVCEIQVESFRADAQTGGLPFIVRDVHALTDLSSKNDALCSKLDFFKKAFTNSSQHKTSGRGQMFLRDLPLLRQVVCLHLLCYTMIGRCACVLRTS
jgi:hypothetical protein